MGSTSKSWGNRIVAIIILLVLATVLTQVVSANFLAPKATLHLGDGKFTATLATTEKARIKGLSGTRHLPADHAMVLVFDSSARPSIWMKDMHYAIDVVWLNESKQVVDFVLNVTPESYPTVFTPKEDARYVVELKGGTAKAKNIRVGQLAVFSGTNEKI